MSYQSHRYGEALNEKDAISVIQHQTIKQHLHAIVGI